MNQKTGPSPSTTLTPPNPPKAEPVSGVFRTPAPPSTSTTSSSQRTNPTLTLNPSLNPLRNGNRNRAFSPRPRTRGRGSGWGGLSSVSPLVNHSTISSFSFSTLHFIDAPAAVYAAVRAEVSESPVL